jgi:hypothetical protein
MEDLIPVLSTIIAGISAVIGLLSTYRSRLSVKNNLLKSKKSGELEVVNDGSGKSAKVEKVLIDALEGIDSGAIQVGNFLLIKHTDDNGVNINSITLTVEQLTYIETHPKALSKPKDLLLRLSEFKLSDNSDNSIESIKKSNKAIKSDS